MLNRVSLIMIVSQSDKTCQELRGVLLKLGYAKASVESSAESAIKRLETNASLGTPISLILFDWALMHEPKSDSLPNISQAASQTRTPIIVSLENEDLALALLQYRTHFQGYVIMPCTECGLKASIAAAASNAV